MAPSEEENHFYDLLRQKFDGLEEQPLATTWPAVSQTLPPVPQPWYRSAPVGGAGLLGVLLGVLIGWWANVGMPEKGHFQRPLAVSDRVTKVSNRVTKVGDRVTKVDDRVTKVDDRVTKVDDRVTTMSGRVTAITSPVTAIGKEITPVGSGVTHGGSLTSAAGTTTTSLTTNIPVPVAPIFTIWTTALAQDSAIRQEGARAVAPVRADSASRLTALVAEQRATLGLLQHRLDSLKAALPMEPPLLAQAGDSAKTDSVPAPTLPTRQRWALTALVEPSKTWGTLPGYPTGETRENLNNALTRGIRLERALNDRWTVRLGLGEARVRGQFAYEGVRTGERTKTDTTLVTVTTAFENRDTTFIIQQYQTPQLNPRINGAGQIIGYDTLYITRYDTSYQIVISHDTIRRTEQKITTRTETWRERQQQQLRPEYRFWTIPISMQYDVLAWRRWRAGVSAGAQVVVFRGGWQPTWRGDQYELRRIGPRDGPFRPVSLALTTALEVRYRLTDRLSLLGGGTVRGWAVNPVKGATKVQLTPGALVGVSWGFGK